MNSLVRFTPVLTLLVACASATEDTASNGEADVEVDAFNPVAQLATMLSGEFDSSAQAAEMPSYYDVHLWGCDAEAPELDGVALYIEQALSTDQRNPYRQRLYLLTELEPSDKGEPRARSAVYAFSAPSQLVGSCADGTVQKFELDDLELREGCEVDLTWNGETFIGGTMGEECASTIGGDYAVSDIEIFEDRIESWDRGFYNSGAQAWGATEGPYIFDRLND